MMMFLFQEGWGDKVFQNGRHDPEKTTYSPEKLIRDEKKS